MKRDWYLLMLLVIIKFIIQFNLISPNYELHRDEYLHLDQANHLAWGFHSVPPFTSWLSYIIKLLGNGVFWIKFFPALFGALTTVIVWKAVEVLQGNLFAKILAATCVTFSVLFRLNVLFQPNSFDVLCWTACYYCVLRYLDVREDKWLYAFAVTFAIGFLNKYNLFFLLVGLLPGLLLTRDRIIFKKKAFYWSIFIIILIILPNLIWQYNHDFPVFQHLKELAETQLAKVERKDFIFGQLIFFPFTILIPVLSLIAFFYFKRFHKYRVFFWCFVITLFIFISLKAKNYYAIGLYPIYFSFGSVYLESWFKEKWTNYLKPILIAIPILLFLPIYFVAFPNRSPDYIANHPHWYNRLGLLKWEDGKNYPIPQDFADMIGWKELATKVDQAYLGIKEPGIILVLCDNYGQAGAINFYSKQGIQAVSFEADYLNWIDLKTKYSHLIRIKNRGERVDEWNQTSGYFEHSKIIDSVETPYAREYGTVIFSFEKTKIDLNKAIAQEVEEEKSSRLP